jgi:hypothetical protein
MFTEWCSNCETEQELDESLGLIEHKCECGGRLLPCRLCTDMHSAYGEIFGGLYEPNCALCPFNCKEVTA